MKTLSGRNKKRLLHHLALAMVSFAALSALYLLIESDDFKFRLSLASGYLGLALLAATFSTGAINLLRGRPNPVSTDLRRDLGIWCGVVSLGHVAIGLQVHMGSMLLYFFREASGRLGPRLDLFGFANYTGLIAAFIILLLLALSNDFSLRRLKKKRWKFFQRWNYAAAALIILHSVAYQIIEKRQLLFVFFFVLLAAGAFTIQALGFRQRRAGNRNSSDAPNHGE